MEENLQPDAVIPAEAPSDLEQPLNSVAQQAQTKVVQAMENQMMQEELVNGEKTSPISKEDNNPSGKAEAAASASQWPSRVNWNAAMVKLLVSAVTYVDDDINDDAEHAGRMRRIGKWSLVSSAMTERGCAASPQQCADKFHDLNKRYKRVTEILGYGTACKVVEKPALLEKMKIPGKHKAEARKQLSSKNLHYEQMCSYHNRNRISLLDDPALQEMLRRMARGGSPIEQGKKKGKAGNVEEDDPMLISDEEEKEECNDDMEVSAEEHRHRQGVVHATKKLKNDGEEGSQDVAMDMKIIQIQRERLKIRKKTLEMRQSHLEQTESDKEQDKELQKLRLDNERMELENDQLELEMERKIKEMEKMGIKPKGV